MLGQFLTSSIPHTLTLSSFVMCNRRIPGDSYRTDAKLLFYALSYMMNLFWAATGQVCPPSLGEAYQVCYPWLVAANQVCSPLLGAANQVCSPLSGAANQVFSPYSLKKKNNQDGLDS